MGKQKTSLAETVDAKGNVHETVAENIRSYNNAPELPELDLKAMLDVLFPVGSIFIGCIPEAWLKVTKWSPIKTVAGATGGYLWYNQTQPQSYWSTTTPSTRTYTTGTGTSKTEAIATITILTRLA